MTDPKVFNSKVIDEYGGEYPDAIVTIRKYKAAFEEIGESKDGLCPYETRLDVNNLAYQLSYHYNENTRAQGKKKRPLFFESGDGMSDVYVADLTLEDVRNQLDGDGESTGKILNAIKADFISKYNQG